MDNIRYSIITPVFNREDCIVRCLVSVARNQDEGLNGGFEHIIVDDGSTDNTTSIVEEYARKHPHVEFIRFKHNRGTNAARNAAIQKARGEWCIILDSDDYFVDDALQTIASTMASHPGYKHYMFAPDDMQHYYERNLILQGAEQKVLTYPDFLNGYVGGDFIHVCNTEILRRHPFDERLRIYEGVFFLMFFKEAQQMLFTNKVVTIRERSRKDSVTRDMLRTNDKVIGRSILYNEIYLKHFEEDLKALGMLRRLRCVRSNLLDNYVLLSEYDKACGLMKVMGSPTGLKERLLRVVVTFRCGWAYKWMLHLFLNLKYRVFKKKMA